MKYLGTCSVVVVGIKVIAGKSLFVNRQEGAWGGLRKVSELTVSSPGFPSRAICSVDRPVSPFERVRWGNGRLPVEATVCSMELIEDCSALDDFAFRI